MKMQRANTVRLLALAMAFSTILALSVRASAAWPWDRPSDPGYPQWEPQREWVQPPDEDPPTISVTVRQAYSPETGTTEKLPPPMTWTDSRGVVVEAYELTMEWVGWHFRPRITVQDGTGEPEDSWRQSGVDKDSVRMFVGKQSYAVKEHSSTLENSHKAVYQPSIVLKAGLLVDIVVEGSDNIGNVASTKDVRVYRVSVKEPSDPNANYKDRTAEELDTSWETQKRKAKARWDSQDADECVMRLEKRKGPANGWVYYVVAEYEETETLTFLHGGEMLSQDKRDLDQVEAKDAYNAAYWSGGDTDEYYHRVYYYWGPTGTFLGFLTGGDTSSAAFKTTDTIYDATQLKDAVGGDYGGKYTGLGG